MELLKKYKRKRKHYTKIKKYDREIFNMNIDEIGINMVCGGIEYMGLVMVSSECWIAYKIGDPERRSYFVTPDVEPTISETEL